MLQTRQNHTRAILMPMLFLGALGCFPALDLMSDTDLNLWDGGEQEVPEGVTVATFNVENFDLGGEATGQYEQVAAFAADSAVDILVLEEVQKDANGDDEALFLDALNAAAYTMPYSLFSSMSDGFNAIAVWSRYPILSAEEIMPSATRTAVHFVADINGTAVSFIACHLKSGDDPTSIEKRLYEATALASYIQNNFNLTREGLVVLGDMNTSTQTDFTNTGTMDMLTLQFNNTAHLYPVNLTELPGEPTYPSSDSILDHILLSPAALSIYIQGSASVPHPKGDGPYGPSDHYPVTATFNL